MFFAITCLANSQWLLALDWAERTIDERSPNAVLWKVGNAAHLKLAPASFLQEPWFIELLSRMKLLEE